MNNNSHKMFIKINIHTNLHHPHPYFTSCSTSWPLSRPSLVIRQITVLDTLASCYLKRASCLHSSAAWEKTRIDGRGKHFAFTTMCQLLYHPVVSLRRRSFSSPCHAPSNQMYVYRLCFDENHLLQVMAMLIDSLSLSCNGMESK